MTNAQLETIPAIWTEERDGAFFAIVQNLFRPAFTSGATTLLMTYDEDSGARPGPVSRPAPAQSVLQTAPATRS